MSLEEALNNHTEALSRNSDLLVEHNGLMTRLLASASKAQGAAAATTEAATPATAEAAKGKPGRPKKTDTAAAETTASTDSAETASGVGYDDLKKKLLAWLGEFAKDADKDNPEGMHPEVAARKAALAKAYASDKLKIENMKDIKDDPAKIAILDSWFENKVKTVDKGFGIGRFVADPEPAAEAEDDGMDI